MLTVETPSRNNPPIPYIIMSSRTHCRPHRGRTMLSRWWLPVAVVYVRLRCMPIYVVWLLVLFPSSRKAGISPPLSADIPARVRRYLRPHSAIPPPFFLRFSSLSPLFLVSFSSLLPLFQLKSNPCSTPIPDSPARGFLSSFHPVCSFFDCRFSSFSLLFPSVSRPIRTCYVHKTYKKPSSQCSLLSRGGAGTGHPGHPLAFLGGDCCHNGSPADRILEIFCPGSFGTPFVLS